MSCSSKSSPSPSSILRALAVAVLFWGTFLSPLTLAETTGTSPASGESAWGGFPGA
jgi:hypothetical protein